MISRMRAGFVDALFDCVLVGVDKLGRLGSGFEARGRGGADVVGGCVGDAEEATERLFVTFDDIVAA
jgi:hypothetical protein